MLSYLLRYDANYEFQNGRFWDRKRDCLIADVPSNFLDGKSEKEIEAIFSPIIRAYENGRKQATKEYHKKIKNIFGIEE